MNKVEKSIISYAILLSPMLIMGRPIVGTAQSNSMDYYQVLGLTEASSQDDVVQAYYRLSQIYNPEFNIDAAKMQMFQQIKEGSKIDSYVLVSIY